jgi:hypothetical protein
MIQRDQDGERRQMAGAVIAGRPAGPCRLPGATEPRLHPGNRLAQLFVAAPAGAETAIGVGVDRRIDNVRAAQRGLAEPQPLRYAAHKILVKHIGALDKAPQEFSALRRFEVEQKRPFAAAAASFRLPIPNWGRPGKRATRSPCRTRRPGRKGHAMRSTRTARRSSSDWPYCRDRPHPPPRRPVRPRPRGRR